MPLSSFAKSTSLLAITRLVEFVVGLVRVKLNALYLGVAGVGLVEQLAFFAQQTSTFTLLSMGEGLVKLLAENKNADQKTEIICSALKAYMTMISLFMVFSVSLLVIFKNYFMVLVFGDGDFFIFYLVALLCVPLLILNSIPFSILKAFKGTIYIAKARMLIVLVNLSFLIPMIVFYGIKGAVIYLFLSYAITLLINFIFAKRVYLSYYQITLKKVIIADIRSAHVSELLVFSTFGATVGLLSISSEMVIRSIIVDRMGVEGIGLYSPVIMWASMFTGVVLPAFSTYLYPRFCSVKSTEEIGKLINDGLRLASFAILPFLAIGIPFKEFFVSLFYSIEFIDAAQLVPVHFLGLVFYSWWYVFSQSLTPTGRIRQHGFLLTLFYLTNILVVYLLIDEFGLLAYAIKFFLPPLIFFFIYHFYCRKKMKVIISRQNIWLMIYVFVVGSLLVLLSLSDYHSNTFMFLAPTLIPVTYLILSKSEKQTIGLRLMLILKQIKTKVN